MIRCVWIVDYLTKKSARTNVEEVVEQDAGSVQCISARNLL